MIIRSEAAVLFASIVLKALSEKIETLWPTIVDTEWLSFCEGLAVLYCMKVLWHQDSEEKENVSFNLLSMIPDNGRQQEVATKLLSLLSEFRWVPKKNQEMALYKLINRDHLTLEHLEVAASFETYTSYLTQFVIAHQKDGNELQENIQIQLNKLLKENHFSSYDVRKWQGFTMEQKTIIRHIWTPVIPATEPIHPLDGLFDDTHRKLKVKMEINDKVVTCLNAYCQQASDKEAYHQLVRLWHDRFDREIIQSIEIPPILKQIIPFADKLNKFANVRSWRAFLNQKMTINDSSIETIHMSQST
ncbi:unnamed protein product, partial [Rotaria sp. Silwood2]